MLRLTLELLPGGGEAGRKVLGTLDITNDKFATGQTNGALGDYDLRLVRSGRPTKVGRVLGFRRATRDAWDLAFLAMGEFFQKRNRGRR